MFHLVRISTQEVVMSWEMFPGGIHVDGFGAVLDPVLGSQYGDYIFKNDTPPTASAVVAERERRLALGFDHDFGGARGVHRIATTAQDMIGWDEVTKVSQALIAVGLGAAPIDIVTDTGPCEVTALEWQQVLITASQARQPIWAASFALQAMDPIPGDYADDSYWQPAP